MENALGHFSVDLPEERARRQYGDRCGRSRSPSRSDGGDPAASSYGEREATQGKSVKNVLVFIVRLAEIYKREHHKNKGLQYNDQNMKNRPQAASNHMSNQTQRAGVQMHAPQTAEQRNQQKQQLARIHRSEEHTSELQSPDHLVC